MIAIILIVLILLIIFRLSTYIVYGPFIKDKDWVPILKKQIQNGSELNQFDSSIIYIGDLPYITNLHSFDILGKYYINNIGVVPRWSESHKIIKAEFEKCKKEQFNKYK